MSGRDEEEADWRPKTRLRCLSCKTVIQSRWSGDWQCCACFANEEGNQGIYVDETRWYTRIGGTNYAYEVPDDNEN